MVRMAGCLIRGVENAYACSGVYTSGMIAASNGGFYTTQFENDFPVACASFTDNRSVPLESIRDQGACLDASNALYAGSDILTVTTYQVFASHEAPCSGCFAFTDATPGLVALTTVSYTHLTLPTNLRV